MKVLGLVWLLALGGCLSSMPLAAPRTPLIGIAEAPPEGQASLCVVRPQDSDVVATYAIYVDERLVGGLRGPSWFCVYVAPGFHRVVTRVDDPGPLAQPRETSFVAIANQRHYLRHETHIWRDFIELTWIDAPTASAATADARNLILR